MQQCWVDPFSLQEDVFVCGDKFGDKPGDGLFAVFDGHAGRESAAYASENLPSGVQR